MSFLKRIKEKIAKAIEPEGKESISLTVEEQNLDELLDKLVETVAKESSFYTITLSEIEPGKAILGLDKDDCLLLFSLSLSRFLDSKEKKGLMQSDEKTFENDQSRKIYVQLSKKMNCEGIVANALLRRNLSYKKNHIHELLSWLFQAEMFSTYSLPISRVITIVENYLKSNELDETSSKYVTKILQRMSEEDEKECRQLIPRVRKILGQTLPIPLNAGEAWSDKVIADIDALEDQLDSKDVIIKILALCQKSDGGKPSKKWLAEMQSLLDDFGAVELNNRCKAWFPLVDKSRTVPIEGAEDWYYDPNLTLDDANTDVLKGLVWCVANIEDAEMARILVKLALSCFRKVPGVGPRSARVGNACIYALANMSGKIGLYQLAVLKVKIKNRSALKILDKAMVASAEKAGITVDELEEMGVPSYGLDSVGYGEEVLGDFVALVEAPDTKTVTLTWRKADGKVQKTIPAAIKENFSAELKDLRGDIKDIKAMMSVQKIRVENLFLKEMTWTYATWAERYLNHPIVGLIARKLIWRFKFDDENILAIYNDGEFIDQTGNVIEDIESSVQVELWHPITSDVEEIKAWRERVVTMEVVQPFKQAHREIYLLTDAEITTDIYSNRFASHIIKQHQFKALADTRGWRYSLQGAWDCDDIAQLHLERFNLWAEFWVEGVGEYGEDTSESGIFLYVSTDQVRFYQKKVTLDDVNEDNINSQTPMSLKDVPALVLSEVFRDADLFVGVCSVGNNPEWSDGGPEGQFRDYWHSFSFGDLSVTAQTRKEILEKLVPKLKIAPQCKFVDKFLVVEGSRRVYKIHLGSGNILMEPNNQYLCIVTDRKKKSPADKIFLPFEGDSMLSAILSKAVLLADDKKIKDSTINSQIDSA